MNSVYMFSIITSSNLYSDALNQAQEAFGMASVKCAMGGGRQEACGRL